MVPALAPRGDPTGPVAADPADSANRAPQWLVEFESAPAADGTSVATLDSEHRRFRTELGDPAVRYRQRFSYETLFNGVSVSAGDAAAARIGRLDGVAAVYPVEAIPLDTRPEAFRPGLAFAPPV